VTEKILDCQDKRTGTLLILQSKIQENLSSRPVAEVKTGFFIRGLTGFGNEGEHKVFDEKMPTLPYEGREPDYVVEQRTMPN